MTVSSTTTKSSHSGDGSLDTFAYAFRIFADDDLVVIIRTNSTGAETTKTKTTHYTVTGVGSASGGNVVFTSGNIPTSGETVVIKRSLTLTQATDYVANDPFPADSHEDALDRLTMIAQQQQEVFDRAVVLPETDTASTTIPNSVDRASKYLAFNSSGDFIATAGTADVTPISSAMTPVVGGSTLANARTEFFSGTNLSFDGSGNVKSTNVVADVLQLDDDDDSNSIKLQAPSAVTTTTTFTLPNGDGDSGQTLITNGSGVLSFAEPYGNRNLIINGAMKVAQRGTTSTATGYKSVDRFTLSMTNFDNAAITQAQSSLAPTGFSKSYRIDCTTIETALAADEFANVSQVIEAQNLQHIQNGSSGAKSLTLSFYVKSNKTGTYGVNLYKPDSTARQITATYAISSADTWEFKTITFAGDTAGGGITDDTGAGIHVYWHLAAGSNFTSSDSTSWGNYADAGFAFGHAVNIFDNTANDWAVTGVQLEVGTVATPFEHRSFGDELARCQRYFESVRAYFEGGTDAGGRDQAVGVKFSVEKRAAPTVTRTNISTFNIASHQTAAALDTAGAFTRNRTTSSGGTTFHDQLDCDSEL